ncbi:hypothetical protein [Micromonospora rubida]|uniref:hypothetical protein n=1 Tax=Micromonospora rubida TaxID=2697657 RepID=UPI002E2BF638|nr:hypothetical protein [Micromonospora rubida]
MSGYGVSLAELRRHTAARPTWRCRVCAAPWPCQPAKLSLRTEYARDRVALAIYLCVLMHDAIADRLRTHPDEVDPKGYFDRFISWTRQPSPLHLPNASPPDPTSGRPWTPPVRRSRQVSKVSQGSLPGTCGWSPEEAESIEYDRRQYGDIQR